MYRFLSMSQLHKRFLHMSMRISVEEFGMDKCRSEIVWFRCKAVCE